MTRRRRWGRFKGKPPVSGDFPLPPGPGRAARKPPPPPRCPAGRRRPAAPAARTTRSPSSASSAHRAPWIFHFRRMGGTKYEKNTAQIGQTCVGTKYGEKTAQIWDTWGKMLCFLEKKRQCMYGKIYGKGAKNCEIYERKKYGGRSNVHRWCAKLDFLLFSLPNQPHPPVTATLSS